MSKKVLDFHSCFSKLWMQQSQPYLLANIGTFAGAKADDAPEANRFITSDNGVLTTDHKKPQKTTPITQKEKTNESHHLPRYLFLMLVSQLFCRTDSQIIRTHMDIQNNFCWKTVLKSLETFSTISFGYAE